MPLFSGERVLPPCRRMALSPLSRRRPGHYSAGGAAATAVWREYRPTAGALAAVGFPRRMGAVQRRDRCAGLDFNIMTQRGRASATVQVVSDLQCPASEGSLMFYKASGIWPGDAARPAAASAGAVDPRGICVPWAAMDACCWRRSRSNNRQER